MRRKTVAAWVLSLVFNSFRCSLPPHSDASPKAVVPAILPPTDPEAEKR